MALRQRPGESLKDFNARRRAERHAVDMRCNMLAQKQYTERTQRGGGLGLGFSLSLQLAPPVEDDEKERYSFGQSEELGSVE